MSLTTTSIIALLTLNPECAYKIPVSPQLHAQFRAATHDTGVDTEVLAAVCWVESKHRVLAYAPKDGATPSLGICQIKLKTALFMGFAGSKAELMLPENNIHYAAKYLAWQEQRYKQRITKVISAYNAGNATVNNRGYVNRVLSALTRGFAVCRK